MPGLNLFDIKCAWLNEQEYCEFSQEPCSPERGEHSISLAVVKYMMCDVANTLQTSLELVFDFFICVT